MKFIKKVRTWFSKKTILKKHVQWFSRRIQQDRIDTHAAHASYYIMISFLPFMAILVTLFQTINFSGTTLMQSVFSILPNDAKIFIEDLFRNSAPAPNILSISAVTAIWASSTGMLSIVKGLNRIYREKDAHSYIRLRLISAVYVFLMAVTLFITAVTVVFGSTLYEFILLKTPPFISYLLGKFQSTFGLILLVIFFCLLYNVIPREKAKFFNNLVGAVFSALGWVLFSNLFSIFVENFSNFSIYGSLATLVIIMTWLYACLYILYLGAEVSVWLQYSGIKKDLKYLINKFRRGHKLSSESKKQHSLAQSNDKSQRHSKLKSTDTATKNTASQTTSTQSTKYSKLTTPQQRLRGIKYKGQP